MNDETQKEIVKPHDRGYKESLSHPKQLEILQKAHDRVKELSRQEQEEFSGWVSHILMTICGDKESVAKAISEWNRNGESDMPIEYNIVRVFKQEKEAARDEGRLEGRLKGRSEGRLEGKMEAMVRLLESRGFVSEKLRADILSSQSSEELDKLFELAIESQTVEEFEERKNQAHF
ncbi:MAG: hypothetical protein K6G30_12030 [Acetatifactor sp.]|nr:hypothetical protein [Acetatifactor sp.]